MTSSNAGPTHASEGRRRWEVPSAAPPCRSSGRRSSTSPWPQHCPSREPVTAVDRAPSHDVACTQKLGAKSTVLHHAMPCKTPVRPVFGTTLELQTLRPVYTCTCEHAYGAKQQVAPQPCETLPTTYYLLRSSSSFSSFSFSSSSSSFSSSSAPPFSSCSSFSLSPSSEPLRSLFVQHGTQRRSRRRRPPFSGQKAYKQ